MSKPSIRNVVEQPWQQFPGHFGGALSKALVRPENVGSSGSTRISTYQPMAYVETHRTRCRSRVSIVRRHDVIFIPPGVKHSIRNNGLTDLTFIVATTPVDDR